MLWTALQQLAPQALIQPDERDGTATECGARTSHILARRMLRHAIPIVAHFDWAFAVTLAAPEASLQPLVAPGLALDTFKGRGFLAVACVQTRCLRPRGCPRFLGLDFFLVGYRVFVRFTTRNGTRLRGLQILGSETDRRSMAIGGRLFRTHYDYRTVQTSLTFDDDGISVSTSSGLDLASRSEASLPPDSPFADWNEARRFAGPMPFTFAATDGGRAIVRVEGTRVHWVPKQMSVERAVVPFLTRLAPEACPAAAFLVTGVDYAWKRGVVERVAR
jgi:hypothetical protein